jgi:putative adhesin
MRRTMIGFCKRIVLALAAVVFCSSTGCRPSEDSVLEEVSDQRYPIGPTPATISVTNGDGSIRIYGAGRDVREVRVQAVKKAYTPERLKAISIQVAAAQNSISIKTICPPDSGAFSDRSGTVDYVIVVPQMARISKLELNHGEVLIEELRGKEAHAHLGSGRFFVHNCFGNLDIGVQTGNLALVYEWWEEVDFSIRAHVEDGNSFAYFPAEAVFHLIAHTATGKVANDFEERERRQAEPTNQIDQLVGGADKPRIEIETNDGNIRIAEHTP